MSLKTGETLNNYRQKDLIKNLVVFWGSDESLLQIFGHESEVL